MLACAFNCCKKLLPIKSVPLPNHANVSPSTVFKYWSIQLISWIGIIFISRVFTGLVLLTFRSGFAKIANEIASLFTNNPKLLLVFVMIICPGIMNLIQVWIQDNILKKEKSETGILDRGLLNNMDSDGIGDEDL